MNLAKLKRQKELLAELKEESKKGKAPHNKYEEFITVRMKLKNRDTNVSTVVSSEIVDTRLRVSLDTVAGVKIVDLDLTEVKNLAEFLNSVILTYAAL